ncbi:MAG TPA: hemerythrin domain-containing protein [Kofleriaceae bacterium]|nr:hemerythrin domain-containing protein [Kofleriaceae bacterium]
MATDFLALLRRDHDDLERALAVLVQPTATFDQIRTALDGIRLGLTAHAEAEDIVLARGFADVSLVRELETLIGASRAGHLAQEGALASLMCAPPATPGWRDRARHLRVLVAEHASWEERNVLPTLKALAPEAYGLLAGAFATERLRQLAMLQPSGPIYVPEVVQRELAQARAS